MYVLYVGTKKCGYDQVIVSDDYKQLYNGRCGTIPLSTESEHIEVEIKNSLYEQQKIKKVGIKELLRFFSIIIIGFIHTGDRQGLGKPYYFKIKLNKQPFMQLQFDDVYKLEFRSNVAMTQQKIKDRTYQLYWILSYIIPLQIITIFLFVLALIFRHSILFSLMVTIIALISQVSVIQKLISEL